MYNFSMHALSTRAQCIIITVRSCKISERLIGMHHCNPFFLDLPLSRFYQEPLIISQYYLLLLCIHAVLSALSCSCCGQEACPQLSPSITDFVPPCNTSKDCGSQSKICCDGSCVQAFCTDGASYNLSLYETYSTGGAYDCTIV